MKWPSGRQLVLALVAAAIPLWFLRERAPSAPLAAGAPDPAPAEASPTLPVSPGGRPQAPAPVIAARRRLPKFVAPPGQAATAAGDVTPPPPAIPGQASGTAAPVDVYTALGLSAAETQHARDILQIQRQRLMELSRGLREKTLDRTQFRAQMRELGKETDDNLGAVLGAEKLAAWRAYQEQQSAPLPGSTLPPGP